MTSVVPLDGLVTSSRGSVLPRGAFERRCADMLLNGGGAARGPVQRRRSDLLGARCSRGARGAPRRHPWSPKGMRPPGKAMPKARCSRAPPPWRGDDTP